MSLKVISQNTAVKRIATYVGIGIAGAIIYTTINNTVNSNAELDYKQKIEVINEAINKKDTKLAKKVFEELEQNKIFKGGDESKFELTIKRIEDINNFENTIAEEKIDSALVLLAKVKKKGIHNKDEIKRLENIIYENSEDGMYKKWIYEERDDKIETCVKYMRIYQNGKFEKDAIQEILTGGFNKILSGMNINKNYDFIMGEIKDINSKLKKYSNKNVKIGNLVKINNFISTAEKYYKQISQVDTTIAPRVGDMISFTKVKEKWVVDYINERSATIPFDSEGKIIAVSENGYMVKFPKIKKYAWKTNWGVIEKYSKNGEKNVAEFEKNEIVKISNVTDIEKNRLMEEINNVKLNFEPYKSKTPP